MKLTFIFLLYLLLTNASMAQSSYQAKFTYNASVYPAYSLLPAADSGTITFGNVYACDSLSNCIYTIYARHFDAKGNLVWAKNYRTPFSVSQPQTFATKDGGFIVLGYLYDRSLKSYKGGLVAKCNSAGNVVWSREILSKNYTAAEPGMIGEDASGNILLFSTVGNDFYSTAVLQVVKLNSKGNILWSRTGRLAASYPTDFYESSSFKQIGDRYNIMGAENCQLCEGIQTANLLVMDTAGNMLKTRDIHADSTFGISTGITDLFARDTMLYALGSFDDGYTFKKFLIPLMDTSTVSSGILFSPDPFSLKYQLRTFKNIYPLSVDNLTYFNKDGILTQQAFSSTLYHPSFTIQQYDSLNRLCPDYNRPVADTTSSQINMIIGKNRFDMISDSVYLTAIDVTVRSGTFDYQLICNNEMVTDKTGNNIPVKAHDYNRNITIYPNPVKDILHINGLQLSGTAVIYSSVGYMVKKALITSLNSSISVADLKSDVYFLRIMENGKKVQIIPFIKTGQ